MSIYGQRGVLTHKSLHCSSMKYSFVIYILLLFVGTRFYSIHANKPEHIPFNSKVPFDDSFIMLWQGKYYAYRTLFTFIFAKWKIRGR